MALCSCIDNDSTGESSPILNRVRGMPSALYSIQNPIYNPIRCSLIQSRMQLRVKHTLSQSDPIGSNQMQPNAIKSRTQNPRSDQATLSNLNPAQSEVKYNIKINQ